VSQLWPYRDSKGGIALYACRFDPNPEWKKRFDEAPSYKRPERPDRKTYRPLSFWQHEDGKTRWAWVAPKSGIPLYGSDKLAAKPNAKVIVCEGEKAADAAQELFPDCVAVTWYSGAKRVTKAPWDELAKSAKY
jgi:hypothetical protein